MSKFDKNRTKIFADEKFCEQLTKFFGIVFFATKFFAPKVCKLTFGPPCILYTGWAKSQYPYVGPHSTAVFYILGLLLCRWHTAPTCSRIP